MEFVIIESPFVGNIEFNTQYAQAAMLDSLTRGEAPFLSHLLYTQVLDENKPKQRKQGITAGLFIGDRADKTVVYQDLGISRGMKQGIQRAEAAGRPIEYRSIK